MSEGEPIAVASKGTTDRHSPGQVLKKERELRGLSVQQAADELNLDRWIVEAIESDNFLALGPPVFARGHLRKYAVLLAVSEDLIVGRYDALSGTPALPVVTPTTTAHVRVRRRMRVYVLPLLLAAIVLVALAWWLRR
jgi:cytoskeleton protein RodZ